MKKVTSFLMALCIMLSVVPVFSEREFVLCDDVSYRDSGKEVLNRFEKGEFSNEVYYLASNAVGWGGGEYDIAVFLKAGNPVVVIYESDYKCRERALSWEEYNSFVKTIEEIDADNLPLWDTYMVYDGSEHEYIHMTDDKKTSVYMNNVFVYEELPEAKNYISLIEAFEALVKDKELTAYYRIEGTELLISSEDYQVYSVYKNGDDFRVLLRENLEEYQWYYFKDGKIDKKADEPEGFTIANAWDNIDDSIYYEHLNNYPWQTTWGEYVVKLSNRGVCLTKGGEKPKLICGGTFSRGVVIPNTDFLVCEEAVNGWAKPRKMVVIDLMTWTKKDAPFPESDKVTPLLILNGKLLFSCNNEAEKKHTYYFYDVVNDTIEEVEGDFSCLGSSVGEGRFLQKASMENKYFTMKQNFSIGFFDTETYKYTELVKVPFLLFSNEDFWIDENEGKIYMVTDGNLISYPIEVDFSIADDIRVLLNGKKLRFDVAPYIKNDRTLVPMRAIFEALGAEVSWDDATKTAIGVKDGVEVKITIGENVLYKNGEAITLDCAAEITNDRTMVPARAISEAFSYIVEWDNEAKTVNILDPYKRKYYTYDEKGQVASISSNLWTSDVVFYSYLYDESGRVIRVWERPMIKNSDRLFEYTYNEKGQVIAKGTCKDWWMDVLRGAPIDKEVTFTEVEKYFYDEEGRLNYAEYPSGGRRYYIYDEEGKLIREENEKGEVVKKYVYLEEGRINYTESY